MSSQKLEIFDSLVTFVYITKFILLLIQYPYNIIINKMSIILQCVCGAP